MFISSSLSCCFIIEAICLHLNSIAYFSFHKSDEKCKQMCEVKDFGDTLMTLAIKMQIKLNRIFHEASTMRRDATRIVFSHICNVTMWTGCWIQVQVLMQHHMQCNKVKEGIGNFSTCYHLIDALNIRCIQTIYYAFSAIVDLDVVFCSGLKWALPMVNINVQRLHKFHITNVCVCVRAWERERECVRYKWMWRVLGRAGALTITIDRR